jgi:hypothetical protein
MRVSLVRALLAASLAVLALAQVAAAASPSRLLAKHQPVTVFTPFESFRPTSVETFVADSNLEALTGANIQTDWVVVNPAPEANSLPTSSPTLLRLNQRACSPAFGLAGLSCYASSWSAHAAPSLLYGRVVTVGDKKVLQYWYFYYDNFYSYAYPPSNFVWQAHEGDWEVVNVVLSAEDDRPLYVGYSQHCLGQTRGWSETPRWRGRHPIVHVAIGSHANFFTAGTHPIDVRCLPALAITILTQAGLALPVDYAFDGPRAGPAALEEERTSVIRVNDTTPNWIRFPGFWGELEYFKSPVPLPGSPTGIVPAGLSPVGPAFHAVWVDPLGTLATWSADEPTD